ncbi:MAG: hypothetical protein IJZ83_07485 [Clostridia bacterium]|nr:hypothetical protein [Clostridia bacterium]
MRKKILSLALACLMIMTAFATAIPVFAVTSNFTVTKTSNPLESTGCATLSAAITQAYTYGGATITLKEGLGTQDNPYKMTTAIVEETSSDTRTTITIEGNGNYITGSTTPFKFNTNDDITVNNLHVKDLTARAAEVYYGTTLKFSGCTFTLGAISNASNDAGGYFRTPNKNSSGTDETANSSVNTMIFENCDIEVTANYSSYVVVFGNSSSKNAMNLVLNNTDVTATGNNMRFMWVGGASSKTAPEISIHSSNIDICNHILCTPYGYTAVITGTAEDPTVIKSNNNKTVFELHANTTRPANIYIGDNVSIKSSTLYNANSKELNIYAANDKFWYKSDGTDLNNNYVAPTLEEGASVRTTDGSQGLRFKATVAGEPATYGMLVTRTDKLTGEFTAKALADAEVSYKMAEADKNNTVDGVYTVALTGISDENVNTQYSARTYATYNPATNVSVTVYGTYNADKNARSIAYVANEAYNDTKTEAEMAADDALAEIYMCKVTVEGETVYSRYGTTQRIALKKYSDMYDGEGK